MKATVLLPTGLLLLVSSVPAHAVNTAKVYKSGPLVLIFVGFFALLIVVQMLPALTTLYGMIKGMLAHRDEQEVAHQTASKEG